MDVEGLAQLKDDLLASARSKDPVPFWSLAQGFYHAVDWTEPWIMALLAGHVIVLLVRGVAPDLAAPHPCRPCSSVALHLSIAGMCCRAC